MFSILQAYATDYGAKIMDDFAKVAGLTTLRGLSESEVLTLLPEKTDAQDFYKTLVEACTLPEKYIYHPRKRIRERTPYLVTYRSSSGLTYKVTIWGYSARQAVGYIRSGKHAVSKFVDYIVSVEKRPRPSYPEDEY